jgi:VWFA-related protein
LVAAGDEPPTRQQDAAPTFGEEVEVTVVNVDVYVRDGEGRPVEGLTVGDFRVTQDGREVPVSNFAVSLIRPIYVVLYVDNVNLDPLQRNRVLTRVQAFVNETLTGPVRMMVICTRPSLEIRQPFTDDSQAVVSALRDVATISGGRLNRDRERRNILDWMEEIDRDDQMENVGFYQTAELLTMKVQVAGAIRAYTEQESNILQDSLNRMREVIKLVVGLEGRKSIIYVSNGLPMTPGLGLMHEYADVFRDNTIYTRQAQGSFGADFTSLAKTANGADVSLYALDATGLGPLEGFGAEDRYVPQARASWVNRQNLQETLSYMADTTSGLAVLNTNDVTEGLELIRDDLFSYYSLGYMFSASGEDMVHEIKVELPGYPKNKIRHRKWFVEKSLTTQVQDRVLSLLVRDIGNDVVGGLQLSVGEPTPSDKGRWRVPIRVSIPLCDLALTMDDDQQVGHVELFFGVRDARGRESPPQRREYEVRIPAARYEPTRNQRYGIDISLLVRKERNTVAVGVLDLATNQTSFGRAVVTVP